VFGQSGAGGATPGQDQGDDAAHRAQVGAVEPADPAADAQGDQGPGRAGKGADPADGVVAGVELVVLGALTLFGSNGPAGPEPIGGALHTWSRVLVRAGIVLVLAGFAVWTGAGGRRAAV
jgi:hypothetical protein